MTNLKSLQDEWSKKLDDIYNFDSTVFSIGNIRALLFSAMEAAAKDSREEAIAEYKAALVERVKAFKEVSHKRMVHDLKGRCDFERINTLDDILNIINNT